MNFKEIQDAVKREIEDFSVEFFTDIPAIINETYLEACDEIDPGVPGLMNVETLNTVVSKAFIPQPGDSSGKIEDIYNLDTGEKLIRITGDLQTLRDKCGSLAAVGSIKYWLDLGSNIWYASIPAAVVVLEIIYYKLPKILVGDGDIPVQIPPHLHRAILVHGTSFKIFSRIEQESEGEAQETAKQSIFFSDGKENFHYWVSRRQRVSGRVAWDA